MAGCTELQEPVILPEGSPVRMILTGRTGEIVDHDPNDLVLPYKIQFDDDQTPSTAWVKKEAFAMKDHMACQPEEPAAIDTAPVEPVRESMDAFLEGLDAAEASSSAPPADALSSEEPCPAAAAPAVSQAPSSEETCPAAADPAEETREDAAEESCPAVAAAEAMPSEALSPAVSEVWSPPAGAEELPSTADEAVAADQVSPAAEDSVSPAAADQVSPATADTPVEESVVVASAKPGASLEMSSLPGKLDKMDIYREAVLHLNEQLMDFPLVKDVADRLRMPPIVVCAAGVASTAAFCLWGFCGQLISTMLGVMLPAFESFKCVEEFSNIKDPSEIYAKASSMQFWLIYWVVLSAFLTIEYTFYYVLIWVPMYYPTKLAILLWLYLPQTRGANAVYHWLVAPTLRRNRRHIDAAIDTSTKHLKRGATGALANVTVASMSAGAGGVASLTRLSSGLVVSGLQGLQGFKMLSKSSSGQQINEQESLDTQCKKD